MKNGNFNRFPQLSWIGNPACGEWFALCRRNKSCGYGFTDCSAYGRISFSGCFAQWFSFLSSSPGGHLLPLLHGMFLRREPLSQQPVVPVPPLRGFSLSPGWQVVPESGCGFRYLSPVECLCRQELLFLPPLPLRRLPSAERLLLFSNWILKKVPTPPRDLHHSPPHRPHRKRRIS